MAESRPEPTGTEAMAFQVVLHRLDTVQGEIHEMKDVVQQLLAKIVDLLEARGKQSEVPVATWEHLYAEVQQEAEADGVAPVAMTGPVPPPKRRGFLGWFTRETSS